MAEQIASNEWDHRNICKRNKDKMDVHFSHHCGENIELSEEKQKASWNHKYSGGIAFSSQPLRPNSKMKLDLTGTGHAYVGIIKRDPASVTNMRKALTSDIIVATEVKVHKRLGAVNIVSDTKDGKDCISFESYNGTKTIDINSEVWLFLYIKFGDMIAVLHSENIHDRCFHHVTGCNIRCLDEDRRSVKLLVENPATVCCLNKKLKPGHSVTIQTNAISENINKPSRCHIKLGFINLDPSELKSRDPESFQVDSKVACPTRWNIVQIFSKENIGGELKLYLTYTGELYFSHDSGIEGTHKCHLNDTSSGITIIFDLFRAEASVSDYHHEESDECEEKDYDYVRPEVEISESFKSKLRISDKQHEKERLSSDYSSSDSDYLEMKDVSDNHKTFSPNCKIIPRLTRCGMYRKDHSSSYNQECS
ncbi:uncharacterized protein LOC134718170 [Mytilus trossulus]|uniref:uncharacterized protein LOC134718170 n=1 Tax=Mytilus trossulus TaxID=6551 RepID=UPI0030062C9B